VARARGPAPWATAVVAAAAAGLGLVAGLAGCGSGEPAARTVAAASTSTPAPAPVAPRPLRVRVYGPVSVTGTATAFPAGGDRVVTVAHVLDGATRRVEVGGRRARVAGRDEATDVAVLAVPGLDEPAPAFADDGEPESPAAPARPDDAGPGPHRLVLLRGGGRRTHAVGTRVLRRATARFEPASGVPRRRPVLELAASVRPGDSGAPVLDGRGRVAGMVFARSTRRAGRAWAVRAPAIRAALAGR